MSTSEESYSTKGTMSGLSNMGIRGSVYASGVFRQPVLSQPRWGSSLVRATSGVSIHGSKKPTLGEGASTVWDSGATLNGGGGDGRFDGGRASTRFKSDANSSKAFFVVLPTCSFNTMVEGRSVKTVMI